MERGPDASQNQPELHSTTAKATRFFGRCFRWNACRGLWKKTKGHGHS